jgi:copper homeostasis protein
MILEICAGSISSAYAAQAGGAHRIELCDNLSEGGTTPSPGVIRQVVNSLVIPVFVLIRPRAGDFLYSDREFEAMKEDVTFCKEHGAKGVVMGLLKSDGTVDSDRTAELVRLAHPMEVTFHRAFDMTRDPFRALEDIISLGIERILTSGQADNAMNGAILIKQLNNQANNRIIILPGGGITENNAAGLLKKTGAKELHASLRSPVISQMKFRNKNTSMGKPGQDEYVWMETDSDRVNHLLEQLNSI